MSSIYIGECDIVWHLGLSERGLSVILQDEQRIDHALLFLDEADCVFSTYPNLVVTA